MAGPIGLVILGSTGSIGRQALDVASRFPERVRVVALAVRSDIGQLAEQVERFDITQVAVADPDAAERLSTRLAALKVTAGEDAVADLASLGTDIVLNALVGAAGLRTTMAALVSGSRLALANKESLVAGGELVTRAARPGQILPVDSEHSAIFQCLVGEDDAAISRIWLTASGGPFLGWDRRRLAGASIESALAHPRWDMGSKITVDSATLMNKGLEAIEAHHLFGVDFDDIRVVVHPQSCVHSMVEFSDGSVKAHLGATDMRIPIQYALSFPERWPAPVPPVDFARIGTLDFQDPDLETFRCLDIALEAGRTGGTMPAAMNAANEVAVSAFLDGSCSLTDIDVIVGEVVRLHDAGPLESVSQVETVDQWARAAALRSLTELADAKEVDA